MDQVSDVQEKHQAPSFLSSRQVEPSSYKTQLYGSFKLHQLPMQHGFAIFTSTRRKTNNSMTTFL